MENAELKKSTFHSVAWTVARIATTNVLSLVVFSMLARILSPREFGAFALATVVVEFTRIVASVGLGDAVLREKRLDDAFADTAFWANLMLGVFVGAVTWFGAPLYASMIRQPEVVPILRWLAVLVPVSSLGGIHTARLLREFGHKALAARVVAGGLLGGIAAVAAAIGGWGVWSLVIQAAVVDFVGLIFAWQSYPWRPRLRFHWRLLAEVSSFSASMMLTQVMFLMLTRVQDLVIGRFVSASALGSYRVGWRMIDLTVQTTIQPIATVSFVTFAHLQEDVDRFKAAFLRMLGLGALITFPALFGLGLLSDEVVALLFGPNWVGTGDIVKIFALMAIPVTLNYFGGHALAALGRSGTIAKIATVQASLTLALSLLAAPFGLQWIAAAYVFRAYLTAPYQIAQLTRDTGIDGVSMLRAVAAPFFASLLMVAVLLAIGPLLRSHLGHGASYVAVAAALGCAAFAGGLLLFGRDYVRANIEALRPLWQGVAAKFAASRPFV